ncbi:MAG: hypothetical protein K0U86_06255 [Planctomycetes bacterium]|nr:hypothetical protein [Planctomycetota bacterium]MCH9724490.1 hypothetical protein [Planctomycetota bacterium]MCH9774851.1 hypothetical protein [Planctomycetota bacterium]MCH9792846.1 hypothetical protein [Planctomycetota bacterium]
MKNFLTLFLAVGCILFGCVPNESLAENQNSPLLTIPAKTDTKQAWIVQITPRISLNSYDSDVNLSPALSAPTLSNSPGKTVGSVVISPRVIPKDSPKKQQRLIQRSVSRTRYYGCQNSFPWLLNYAYGNQYSTPALDMYSDFIRSDWYGSPYRGNYFYNQGYRPSFRFGSLQFQGFGNYDRMYNPRLIPFGYQYSGSRTYYAALAMTAMSPSFPW